MKFILRKDIDLKKWNTKIEESTLENIFQYSWYLDSVSENWGAIIQGDYDTILPIPFSNKLSVKQIIQAPFTREYDIIGDKFGWSEAITFLSTKFKSLHFRNSSNTLLKESTQRSHQILSLESNYSDNYRTNAKRLIKKADKQFTYRVSSNVKILLEIFKETAWSKIDSISKSDLLRLEKLMESANANNRGELIVIDSDDEVVGAGFFLKDKNRITYLKSACIDSAKKQGAMFGLINFALLKYKTDFKTLDFGGSDVESVATFYKKFGAKDRIYYDYSIDNLPFWFKTLKKIKK